MRQMLHLISEVEEVYLVVAVADGLDEIVEEEVAYFAFEPSTTPCSRRGVSI